MPIVQLFTVLGAAGLVICIVSLMALHILPTGFHPIPDPVSNYAVSRYGYLYNLQAFSSGLAGACLLAIFAFDPIALPFWGLAALACYAFSRLLIIFFPTDTKSPRTRTGTIHIILAAFTFAGIAIATGLLTYPLIKLTTWASIGATLQVAAVLTYGAAIAFLLVSLIRPLRRIIGLVERGIYLGALLWLSVAFVQRLLT